MLFDRLAGFTPVPTSQEAFNYFKGLEEPFDATNDAITTLGRLDFQLAGANRLSVRYSYSSNKALNANATGNALDPNTISALTNNGTEKDRTNIARRAVHQRAQQQPAVRGARPIRARGASARSQRSEGRRWNR